MSIVLEFKCHNFNKHLFDTEEHALYLCSCARTGAEILHWSNPGDYDYDEDTFEDPEYEIVEVDD